MAVAVSAGVIQDYTDNWRGEQEAGEDNQRNG